MSDIRDLLRAADGGPPGGLDHGEIRRRGRRLLAVRIVAVVGAVLVMAGVAGGTVLRLTADEPSPPVIDEPPERTSPSPAEDAEEDEDEASDEDAVSGFVPPSSVEDGQHVVTLRFPGGITGEIAYPADLDLHAQGATPGALLSIAAEDDVSRSYGSPRVSGPMRFHHGAREDVLRGLNDEARPELVAEYPGPEGETVPLYATSTGQYLAWQAGGWTLLMREGDVRRYVEPPDPEDSRAIYAANLHLGEDPDGWPIVTADPPVQVGAPYVALGDPEAAVDYVVQDPGFEADLVIVRASACAWSEDSDVTDAGREEPRRVSWCDLATQLSFDVVGSVDFVQSVAQGVEARASEYPPSIIDPGWVTEDAKEAWQAEHGDGTWIVRYFHPPDIQLDTVREQGAGALTPRWKRISDAALNLDREDELREAFTALTGPPPPQLGHVWPGLELELGSAEMDGSELVLDFAVLIAPDAGRSANEVAKVQFDAVAFHYYPEADSICVLVDGEPSEWLHEMMTCPSRDLPD